MSGPFPTFPPTPSIGDVFTDPSGGQWTYGSDGWYKTVIVLNSTYPIKDITEGGGSAVAAGAAGEIQFTDGTNLAASPNLLWDDANSELEVGGDVVLDDGGTFTTTLQTVTPTQNRTISFPDATGTVALVAGSSGQLLYNSSGANAGASTLTYDGSILTSSGRFINSYNATASSPAKAFTGTWFTGGTSTTTKPQVVIEPTGTTSTSWSTSGTGLGVNAASGFVGRLLDLQTNGTSNFNVDSTGRVSFPLGAVGTPSLYPGTDTNTGFWSPAADTLAASTNGTERARIDSSGRLLVGTSTARANLFNFALSAALQIEGENTNRRVSIIGGSEGNPYLVFGRQKGTIGQNVIVSSGDAIGALSFQGNDGTDFVEAATISTEVDGTPGANDMPGRLVFSTTADGAAGPTERMRIDSTGLMTLAGPGIKFPATQVASADPNTLDDYEEGTFTPVVRDAAAGNAAAGYGEQFGRYTKIGNIVNYSIQFVNVNTTGLTSGNQLFVTGLPFTSLNLSNHIQVAPAAVNSATPTTGAIGFSITQNQSHGTLANHETTGQTAFTVSQATSGAFDLWVTGAYRVS
jgi:hypothetical protein